MTTIAPESTMTNAIYYEKGNWIDTKKVAVEEERIILDERGKLLDEEYIAFDNKWGGLSGRFAALEEEGKTLNVFSESAVNDINARGNVYNTDVKTSNEEMVVLKEKSAALKADNDALNKRSNEGYEISNQLLKETEARVWQAVFIVGICFIVGGIVAIICFSLLIFYREKRAVLLGILLLLSALITVNILILIAALLALMKKPTMN